MKYVLLISYCLFTGFAFAQGTDTYSKTEITYDHRDGMALVMTMLTPKKANGKAIISLHSGGWHSDWRWHEDYLKRTLPFVDKGYTVFLVSHSSGPRYSIVDAFEDVQRAIQFVRYNAATYHIDKDYIGITGTSSGGHLSLLAATSDDIADPASKDPVEQVSSKVQAAAVFCPPTDFLNFGQAGFNLAKQKEILVQFDVAGAFQYTKWNTATRTYEPILDENEKLKLNTQLSPAQIVTKDDAPIYIMHGDKDVVVPLQQSQLMEQKLKAAGIPVTLTVKPGADHGWGSMNEDEKEFVKWFDKHLKVTQ